MKKNRQTKRTTKPTAKPDLAKLVADVQAFAAANYPGYQWASIVIRPPVGPDFILPIITDAVEGNQK